MGFAQPHASAAFTCAFGTPIDTISVKHIMIDKNLFFLIPFIDSSSSPLGQFAWFLHTHSIKNRYVTETNSSLQLCFNIVCVTP
jgi:hypothetical protein